MRSVLKILALSAAAACGSSADTGQAQYPTQPEYEYSYQVPQQQPQTQYQSQSPTQTYQQPQTYGRGRLGVALQPMTGELRAYFGAPPDRGVLVSRVLPGSVADQAGLQVGDVVTMIGDHPVTRIDEMRRAIAENVDTTVELQVIRHGQPTMLRATFGPRPPEAPTTNPML